jgi:membrane-bound serine protease (ClpP class)
MWRLLGALALGFALWGLATATVSATEPTGWTPTVVMAQVEGVGAPVTAQAPTVASQPSGSVAVALRVIANPNIAFLLLIVGMVGIVAELYHPGTFVPGIVGVISLLLGLVALGHLPTNWGAAALIVLSLALFLLELHITSHGILGAGGAIAFLLGGLLLFTQQTPASPSAETIEVNRWLLLAVGAGFSAFFLLALRAGLRARQLPVLDPLMRLPGALGVAASPLAPEGTVRVLRETWSAVRDGGAIEPGEEVEVVAREGLTLRVRRMMPSFSRQPGTLPSQGEVRPGVWVERTR